MFKNFSKKFEEVSEKAKEKAKNLELPNIELPKPNFDKIGQNLSELKDIFPLLKDYGYSISEIEISASIPPEVVLHFQVDPNAKDLNELLEGGKITTKMGITVVKALSFAMGVQKSLPLVGERISEIEVSLGIPPSVNIHFIEA